MTQDRNEEKARGDCPVCGRSIQLKTDGTVRFHGGTKRPSWPYQRDYRCAGSDQLPKSDAS